MYSIGAFYRLSMFHYYIYFVLVKSLDNYRNALKSYQRTR